MQLLSFSRFALLFHHISSPPFLKPLINTVAGRRRWPVATETEDSSVAPLKFSSPFRLLEDSRTAGGFLLASCILAFLVRRIPRLLPSFGSLHIIVENSLFCELLIG
ncbi:hypothetical protein BJY00DRAFT_108022 [Aspergillus carlsbadensis]|nr:hypothetical protein BJY00DRAFT_108022 [Aspergillus carlsbadensis]